MERSRCRIGARGAIGGGGLAVLAVATLLAACGGPSPLAGTNRFEHSVKQALNAQLDRGGPFSDVVDVRCARRGPAFRCDTDVVVDATFFRERYRGRFGARRCWTATPVAFRRVAGRSVTAGPMIPLHGCVR